jgi:hypothetical protein
VLAEKSWTESPNAAAYPVVKFNVPPKVIELTPTIRSKRPDVVPLISKFDNAVGLSVRSPLMVRVPGLNPGLRFHPLARFFRWH